MNRDSIVVRGARVHNLKNVDVEIARGKLTVITGPSGSGKSSLAFDTMYAEAQRRYVESMRSHARQLVEQLPKPDVDMITGLPAAIAVKQEAPSKSPRSTVATITEIHDFLRILFARVGQPHCSTCGKPVRAHSNATMVDLTLGLGEGTRLVIEAPVARGAHGDLSPVLERLRREGFVRVVIDGVLHDLGSDFKVDAKLAHDLDVQVDRLTIKDGVRQRLSDSMELALRVGGGIVRVAPQGREPLLFSERFVCPSDLTILPPMGPRLFSWNSPEGACPVCRGLGVNERFDPARIVPDESISIADGAITAWGAPREKAYRDRTNALSKLGVDVRAPFAELPEPVRRVVFYGSEGGTETKRKSKSSFEGVVTSLERQWDELSAQRQAEDDEGLDELSSELAAFRVRGICGACEGTRLRKEARLVTVDDLSIDVLEALSIDEARVRFEHLTVSDASRAIAEPLLSEIRSRLSFLSDVGIGYLTLDRGADTLSTGEAQRIRLATRIGHALVGALYVLDEPSIGLHPSDTGRLIRTLERLRDVGNTVIVVEHDLEIVKAADQIIDMGPGAGALGGSVVAVGNAQEIAENPASATGAFLAGRRVVSRSRPRVRVPRSWIEIRHATLHNLADVNVRVPIGVLTAVTGVSGSGKSSLIVGTLLEAARQTIMGSRGAPVLAEIEGLSAFDRVIAVDDRPIGRTARSNPATYSGLFGPLRDLFASLPAARARGWDAARFSFNQKGGRCEACRGEGVLRIDMQFLPDVQTMCEVCEGRRYDRETLEVRWHGLSIADVLNLSVCEARELMSPIPALRDRLDAMASVGLGYLRLGQNATTLSGGEAQRMSLARELSRKATGRTLYILDEPTTGLHLADVEVLLGALSDLVDQGNTVVVIEHALEVALAADWMIDLGPLGGPGGGTIVVTGTPADVAKVSESHTGRFLHGSSRCD